MDLSRQLQDAGREFAALRKLMKHAESLELAPQERELLMALGTALDGAHADLQKHGPEALADLARQEKEVRASVAESEQALTKAQQELKAALAAPPVAAVPVPAPAAKPIDPRQGQRLALELLERFGDAKPSAATAMEGRAVAEMASAEFMEAEVPRLPTPSPPRERPEPKPNAGSDDWRFSSGNWDKDE